MRKGDYPALPFGFGRPLFPCSFVCLSGDQTLDHFNGLSDAMEGGTELAYRSDNVEGSSSGLLPFDTIPLELEYGRFHFWLYRR